jgi:hypothetical protein
MSNKRRGRNQTQKYYCPHCQRRLWRVGGPKYYLFYDGKLEMQQGLKLSHKTASFLAAQSSTLLDRDIWLEEFFCEEDGKIWMHLSRASCGKLNAKPATREHWKRTTKTPDPERPSSTVSEFTYYMSRQTSPNLLHRVYD